MKRHMRGLQTTMMLAILFVWTSSCLFDTEIRLCEGIVVCAPGWICASKHDEVVCVKIGGCGDGIVQSGEACDDGNLLGGDGCGLDCTSNEVCGNGIIDQEIGENCDDGNMIDGDGCSSDCNAETCGNGFYEPQFGEECDTFGNTSACDVDCTMPMCGDGRVNPQYKPPGASLSETCDPPGDAGCPGAQICNSTCSACM